MFLEVKQLEIGGIKNNFLMRIHCRKLTVLFRIFWLLALAFVRIGVCDDVDDEVDIEQEQKDLKILHQLSNGFETVTRPLATGEESEQGIYTGQWGPAKFKLSMLRGIEMGWSDTEFLLRVGGRMYVDFTGYIEDKNELGDNGLGVRTILVEMNGQFNNNWPYRISWGGFTDGGKVNTAGVKLDDIYIRYLGFDNWVVTFGQHTEPFSLEEQTSSLNITFMERALPNAMAPGSTVGLSVATGGDSWFATGGFFSEQLTEFKDQGSQGYGVTGYISASPLDIYRGVIHFGSSLSYRSLANEKDVFFRYRPESGLTTVRYVNTGVIKGGESIGRFGFDLVWIFGAWSFQSEYIQTEVDRDAQFQDLTFRGWYAFLSWFPTGESRNYKENGIFGSINPQNPGGALEIALRYSGIDLNDKEVRGGEEHNITLGVNWYIHRQLRIMFNYSYVMTDIFANDDGTELGNDNPHIIQMRLQANF